MNDNHGQTKTIGTQTVNHNSSRLWDLEKTQFIGLMVEAGKVWMKLNGEMIDEAEEEDDGLSNIGSGEESWLESEEEEEEKDYERERRRM